MANNKKFDQATMYVDRENHKQVKELLAEQGISLSFWLRKQEEKFLQERDNV